MRNYVVIRSPDYLEHGLLDKLKKVGKSLTSKKSQSSSKKEKSKSGNNKSDNVVRESGVKGKKSKYEGGFITKGDRQNNSQAYNHDYYMKNRWRWQAEYRDGVKYLEDLPEGTKWTFLDGNTWEKRGRDDWYSLQNKPNYTVIAHKNNHELYVAYSDEIDKVVDPKKARSDLVREREVNKIISDLKKTGNKLIEGVSNLIPDKVKNKVNSLLKKVGLKETTTLPNVKDKVDLALNTKPSKSLNIKEKTESLLDKVKNKPESKNILKEDTYVVEHPRFVAAVAKGKLSTILKNFGLIPDRIDLLPKKKKEYSVDEDMAAVNPYYKKSSSLFRENCGLCTMTYDLRRRGYDVTANDANAMSVRPSTLSTYYKNPDGSPVEPDLFERGNSGPTACSIRLFDKLGSEGDGARGMITVYWTDTENGIANTVDDLAGGHAMAWENVNGKTYIIDAQVNKRYDWQDFNRVLANYINWDDSVCFYSGTSAGVRTIRTDDKEYTDVVMDAFMIRNSKDYTTTKVKYDPSASTRTRRY